MAHLLNDVRLALRSFARRPGFTAIVIGTLALGIAATTTVFTVVNGTMLKPLPYANPERLVNVYRLPKTVLARGPAAQWVGGGYWIPPAVVWDWKAGASIFDALGGYTTNGMTVRVGAEPEGVQAGMVTSGVFTTLGVRPLLGQVLTDADDRVGAPGRVVLSYAYWQSRFGGDRAVIGRVIRSGASAYTVIGVMPQGFAFPAGSEDLWVGLGNERLSITTRKSGFLQVIARTKPGVPLSQARAAMAQLTERLAREHPEDRDFEVGVLPRLEVVSSEYGRALLLLLAAVGAVLLIGSSNVANLLLIRATERNREFGLRRALGAPRARLVAGGLVESLLLSLAGGLAGCFVAASGTRAIVNRLPFDLPRAAEVQMDSRVLLFGLVLSIAVGVVIGVLPALRSSGAAGLTTVRDAGPRVAGSRARNRLQMALVGTQIALVVVLLTVTGLLMRSLVALTRVDMGFNPANVLTVNASLPAAQPGSDARVRHDQSRAFFGNVTAGLAAIPGVRFVGAAGQLPTFGWSSPPALIETSGEPLHENVVSTMVTPPFFASMGIPRLAGRTFTDDDRDGTEPVAVVNQSFVRRFWSAEDPVGRRVKLDIPLWPGAPQPAWMTVVGVVGDVRYTPNGKPMPVIYMPHAQQPNNAMVFVLKTAVAPASIAPAVRAVVHGMNTNIIVRTFVLRDRIEQHPTMVSRRFSVLLLAALASVATLMALLGIYGVLAYAVTQRRHEIGIRMALGASRLSVVKGIMRQGLVMAGVGLAAGCACTAATIRTVRALLSGIGPADPATLAAVAAIVLVVVAGASIVPARRATKVDPMAALRQE